MNTLGSILTAAPHVRKAFAALATTLAGTVGLAMLDGHITGAEAVAAAGTALIATASVYGFRNDS